ncbi:unnamed protein product [Timema podura]|uniref:Uncharacterized protein n=1 Tax=Timema podura TaxID=61482 RepID=A0ABN7PTK3_TIMPD|nr:unnamed protein product [Timema podura]
MSGPRNQNQVYEEEVPPRQDGGGGL